MDIKEEPSFLDFCSENETDTKDLVKEVKIETVTSANNITSELEDSTCLQNEEYHLMRFNETIKESEIETKIDIKEEHQYLEREDSCVNDDIKDEIHEDLYSTKPPNLYKEAVSSYTSHFFSSEDLGSDISFKINMDGPEFENDRKCPSAKSVVTNISSVEISVCSETSDDGKIVSMAERIKPHKCIICNMDFTRLSSLKRHKLIHEGIKPHKCNICNNTFTQLSSLKKHKLIHEGIKRHKCIICNRAFIDLSNLKAHKLIHERSRPYKCSICNNAFTRLSHLKTHKLLHEGIKPHKCNNCNKAFTQLSNLKRHKLVHEHTAV